MMVDLDALLSGGGVSLISAIGTFFVMKTKLEQAKEQISALESWRERVDERIGSAEGRLGRGEEKFEQISRDLSDIKTDLRTLLTRRRGDREPEG